MARVAALKPGPQTKLATVNILLHSVQLKLSTHICAKKLFQHIYGRDVLIESDNKPLYLIFKKAICEMSLNKINAFEFYGKSE